MCDCGLSETTRSKTHFCEATFEPGRPVSVDVQFSRRMSRSRGHFRGPFFTPEGKGHTSGMILLAFLMVWSCMLTGILRNNVYLPGLLGQ
jgi:hypothetical protein